MTYEEVIEILKDYGRTKGSVWLIQGYGNGAYKVQLKYDTTRRYWMTPMYILYEEYHGNIPLQRVPQDVFESNVKYLLEHGYTICYWKRGIKDADN